MSENLSNNPYENETFESDLERALITKLPGIVSAINLPDMAASDTQIHPDGKELQRGMSAYRFIAIRPLPGVSGDLLLGDDYDLPDAIRTRSKEGFDPVVGRDRPLIDGQAAIGIVMDRPDGSYLTGVGGIVIDGDTVNVRQLQGTISKGSVTDEGKPLGPQMGGFEWRVALVKAAAIVAKGIGALAVSVTSADTLPEAREYATPEAYARRCEFINNINRRLGDPEIVPSEEERLAKLKAYKQYDRIDQKIGLIKDEDGNWKGSPEQIINSGSIPAGTTTTPKPHSYSDENVNEQGSASILDVKEQLRKSIDTLTGDESTAMFLQHAQTILDEVISMNVWIESLAADAYGVSHAERVVIANLVENWRDLLRQVIAHRETIEQKAGEVEQLDAMIQQIINAR
jgi:hypothetical protein